MDNQFENVQILFSIYQLYTAWVTRRSKSKKRLQEEKLALIKRKQKYRAIITLLLRRRRRRRSFIRACWIQRELFVEDHGRFWEACVPGYTDERLQNKFRLSRTSFEYLCNELAPYPARNDTIMRKAITLPKRIAIALTVLKGNMDFWSVAYPFGIGKSTTGLLLYEFCDALLDRFYEDMITFPITEDERIAISQGFMRKWQFSDCFGAMDGTHILILAPPRCAEDYYNYKSFHFIVILAVVDHNYRFIYSNVRAPGRCNDASVFRKSRLFQKLSTTENAQPQIRTNIHIISDAAFPLLPWVMKPYPITNDTPLSHWNFNYRLSSARMSVENAFRRLKGRWSILLKRADFILDNMKRVIKACLILHNICEKAADMFYPEWAAKVAILEGGYTTVPSIPVPDQRAPTIAEMKRDMLSEKLINDGLSVDNYE